MAIDISRGTNISHWLSQSHARGEERRNFFTRDDVRRIADWGFDHIRIPVDEEQMWDERGNREPEAWDLLNAALDWADEAGLKAVVDLHILRSHYFNAPEEPRLYQDPEEVRKFVHLWEQISEQLSSRPVEKVAYELLNEPVARDPEAWNTLFHGLIEAIRRREAERTIVVGSNDFQQPKTFPQLRLPEDPNCLLSFHFYYPMYVTHNQASWWGPSRYYAQDVQYPGMPIPEAEYEKLGDEAKDVVTAQGLNRHYNRDAMTDEIEPVLEARETSGLGLYCGEFGCVSNTPDEIRKRWYGDIVGVLEANGIAWANWDYKGKLFGLLGPDGEETGVAQMLLGR
ncbi:MAG: glycoside hydrolase family 5 protein [Planctomycetota bacterium]